MDIGNKTRCYRQSKRFDLFSGQWEAKRFANHRKKVENAGPRIDVQTPKSANFQHVKVIFAAPLFAHLMTQFTAQFTAPLITQFIALLDAPIRITAPLPVP